MRSEHESLRKLQAELARCLIGHDGSSGDCHLQHLAKVDLDRSRETLLRKRISQTRALLPKTAASLGTDFQKWFREFADKHHFNGLHAISQDTIAFAYWLSVKKTDRLWIGQLARWESIDCHWPLARTFIKFFRFEPIFLPINVWTTLPCEKSIAGAVFVSMGGFERSRF